MSIPPPIARLVGLVAVACLLGAGLAGCGGSGVAYDPPRGLTEAGVGTAQAVLGDPDPDALDEALDDVEQGGPSPSAGALRERAGDAADWMRAAGLMPVHFGRYYLPLTGGAPVRVPNPPSGTPAEPAHVAGYLTGRHPARQAELVLVAADLGGPPAAAVLEVARLHARAARVAVLPERTLLFALWAPPGDTAGGLRQYLRNPTWSLDSLRAVVLVAPSGELGPLRDRLDRQGVPLVVVEPADTGGGSPLERAMELTRRLMDRLGELRNAAPPQAPEEPVETGAADPGKRPQPRARVGLR